MQVPESHRQRGNHACGGRVESIVLSMVAVLMVIYVGSYAFSVMTIDTGRDWAQAWQIASGSAFTAVGPALKVDVFHFGPIWFYLLGGLFFLTHSVALTSLAVGVLAALKFPLAYICGRRLVDGRLGLLWALMLAMPGWQTMEQVHVTHINLVETLTLLVIYLLIRFAREGGGQWLAALGLVFGLALHAHPSTAPLGLLALGVYLYRSMVSRNFYMLSLLTAAVLFLLPFLPYLVSQTLQGWPEWQRASSYIHGDTGFINVRMLPQLLWSATVYAPKLFSLSSFSGSVWSKLWLVAVYGMYFLAAIGVLWSLLIGRQRKLILIGLFALLVVGAGVLYLRPHTPYYMSYVLYPMLAFLMAMGLYEWDRWLHGKLLFGSAAMVFALFTAVSLGLVQVHRSGEGGFPSGLFMNITAGKFGKPGQDLRFPAISQDSLGRYLCSRGSRVAVHGDLAFIVDVSFSVGSRLHCGERTRVMIAGRSENRKDVHVAGFTRRVWRVLGRVPATWIGPLGVTEALKAIAPAEGIALPTVDNYPPRNYQQISEDSRHWHFTVQSGQVLVISNPFPWYLPVKGVEVTVDGQQWKPLVQTRASRVYPPVHCRTDQPCEVDVKLHTAREEWVDIILLPEEG